MTKTPEQMAEEYADVFRSERRKTIAKKSWWTGYKAAEEKYVAEIKELETQLENWQDNAKHGDEGL